MLLIKNLFKTIVLGSLVCTIILSCSSDAADEAQTPDETAVEDFANFAEDSKFLEYVKQLLISSLRVVNTEKILELHQKTQLTDQESVQLALALGFDDVSGMEAYYSSLISDWLQLFIRFDLKNHEIEKVNTIIIDSYITTYLKILHGIEDKASYDSKDDDLPEVVDIPQFCLDICVPKYENEMQIRDEEYEANLAVCYDGIYGAISEEEKEFFDNCLSRVTQIFVAMLNRAHNNKQCCFYINCEIGTEDGPCRDIPVG